MTIERGDDTCRLTRNIDQNGRRRAAILRAVINAREHDERASGIDAEGDRQQHRNSRNRADARQHADQRADETAEKTQSKIFETERRAEAKREIVNELFHRAALT